MLPILAHIRTSEKYDYQDANIFIEEILSEAEDIPVIVAHLGGWGEGYDSATMNANKAFIEAFEKGKLGNNIYFDLSVVVMSDAFKPYVKYQYEMIAQTIKDIGVDKIVFGSDYPFEEPGRSKKLIMKYLPLDSMEIEQIFRNKPPLKM